MEAKRVKDGVLERVLQKLGVKYQYIKFLGGGGFSKVYLLKHTILDEEHALKIMDAYDILKGLEKEDPENYKDRYYEIKARFLNEAKLYTKIDHPNIVKIHDVDFIIDEKEKIEIPYMTMKYVKGPNLANVIKKTRGPLEIEMALRISKDVLSALDVIHQQRIIHRDVKPANIIIEEGSGNAILIDFGLAKDMLAETTLTVWKNSIGTPAYMSPEQFQGLEGLEVTTDIYSFGIVLYEMLTGRSPPKRKRSPPGYGGDKTAFILDGGQVNPNFPDVLEDIVNKAVNEDPAERFQSAREFLNILEEVEDKSNKKNMGEKMEDNIQETERIEGNIQEEQVVKKGEEDGQKKEEVKQPEKKGEKVTTIEIIVTVLIALIFFIINNTKSCSDAEHQDYIDTAENYIKISDYENAKEFLNKAKAISNTNRVKVLFKRIIKGQREDMDRDFKELKKFLGGGETVTKKLERCQGFLDKHKNVPPNDKTKSIVYRINDTIRQLETQIWRNEQYRKYISQAIKFIEKDDYRKAKVFLRKAGRLQETDEIKELQGKIKSGQIERTKGEFERLKGYLKKEVSRDQKKEVCKTFMDKFKNVPRNGNKRRMLQEVKHFIDLLDSDLERDLDQYTSSLDDAVTNRKYREARDYLKRAEETLGKIKKVLSTERETEYNKDLKNYSNQIKREIGEEEYHSIIRGEVSITDYLYFKEKYPDSFYCEDLKAWLIANNPNLPSEEYWDNLLRKNKNGCYEREFENGHIMIFIPERKFWIDKYEVSNKQFREFVSSQGEIPAWKNRYSSNDCPVTVEYEDAIKYCQWLGFQLPAKDEWEYAAGKEKGYIYPWGNESPMTPGTWRANFNRYRKERDKKRCSGPSPVRSFEEYCSPFGIVNMAGNVCEWVQEKILKGGDYLSVQDDLKLEKEIKGKENSEGGFRCLKCER